jgi:predicted kinase
MNPTLETLWHGDAPIDFDTASAALREVLPLFDELLDTPQDPVWHAEGDVATHTRMVCEELEEATARGVSACTDPYMRRLTRLGALLHDIAKPLVTREDTTPERVRIIAPRHAERGASYIIYRLLDAGCPNRLAFDVARLVELHHEPKFLIIKSRGPGEYRRLARKAPMAALYDLEMADMRGRRCEDRQDQIELIELFRVACEEHGVWDAEQARAWRGEFAAHIHDALAALPLARRRRAVMEGIWGLERGEIFTPHEAVSKELARGERFCELTMLYGPSGSGKSHKAQSIQKIKTFDTVIALDAIRQELTGDAADQSQNKQAVMVARDRLRDALRAQHTILWDATNLIRDFRSPVLQLAMDYQAATTMIAMHVSPDLCHARNAARERSVPAGVVAHQFDALRWPETDEAHHIEVYDHQSELVHSSTVVEDREQRA